MATDKTTAIILRVTEFSETSCIVTMLTREFGKQMLIAKGARRPKSPFEAALDVLAVCRIVFIHKSSPVLGILTEAKLERRFRNATRDLQRLYGAFYVVELLRNLVEEGDPHPELFDLAVETIIALDGNRQNASNSNNFDDSFELNHCLLRFEIGLLKELGHLPMLFRCVVCGRERKSDNDVGFALNAGGIVCPACRPTQLNVVPVSAKAIGEMIQIGENGDSVVKEARAEYRTEQTQSHSDSMVEIRKLMNRYMPVVLGYEPRLIRFLKPLSIKN